jgi:hypothetical protein
MEKFNFCILINVSMEDMAHSAFREIANEYLDVLAEFGGCEKLDEVGLLL